jgi:catechol 1,2-dioxygenase
MADKDEGAPTMEVFPELTRDVIDRMSDAKSARLKEVMEVVIRHLHAIVREAKITQGECGKPSISLRAPARCAPKAARS